MEDTPDVEEIAEEGAPDEQQEQQPSPAETEGTGAAEETEASTTGVGDQERLDNLAKAIEASGRPVFAADRKTDEQIPLPGSPGSWFTPRPITAQEKLRWESMRGRAATFMSANDKPETKRRVETTAQEDEAYLYLVGIGIREYHFISGGGTRHGKYAANLSASQAAKELGLLDPLTGEWLYLWLQVWNGLTQEQERERENA